MNTKPYKAVENKHNWCVENDGTTMPTQIFSFYEFGGDAKVMAEEAADELNAAFAAGQNLLWTLVSEELPELKPAGNEWFYSEDVIVLCHVREEEGTTLCSVTKCRKDPQGRVSWLGAKPFAWMPVPSYSAPK